MPSVWYSIYSHERCKNKGVVESSSVIEERHELRPGNMWNARETVCGCPQRPFCEAVDVKPGLSWTAQDAGDASAVEYLPRST